MLMEAVCEQVSGAIACAADSALEMKTLANAGVLLFGKSNQNR